MRTFFFHLMISILITCTFPLLSFGKTGYVSDTLLLTFRQGPGNEYAVMKTLKSNTPLTILEEQEGYYKVTLQSGETGWVDKKFIMFDLPKTYVIEELEKKNQALTKQLEILEQNSQAVKETITTQESEYSEKIDALEKSLKEALDEKTKLQESLSENRKNYNTLIEQSKNIQKIVAENKILKENNAALSEELDIYKAKSKNLLKTGMIKWFLAGVGVLLFGWILGQSVSSKKRRGSLLD